MFCDDVNANLRFVSFVLSPDYGLFLLCFEFFLFEKKISKCAWLVVVSPSYCSWTVFDSSDVLRGFDISSVVS